MTPDHDVPADPALAGLASRISSCRACPRLVRYLAESRSRWPDHRCKPVPGWGDSKARLLIVGLAPGVHGANKTGRMFSWDSSGIWLYGALFRHGFAGRPTSTGPGDGLRLEGVWISAAARCAPPDNKPLPAELTACRPFLAEEISRLSGTLAVFLALGRIAQQALLKILGLKPRDHPFGHDVEQRLPDGRILVNSYHPSRQNTNTGRLTPLQWDAVFRRCRRHLKLP